MSYNEETKQKRILDRHERESIEYLRMQHLRDKNNFKNRIHTMHPEQIKLEYLLLNLEEQVYFKNKNYYEDEMKEIEEYLFIESQSCCNLKFKDFNDWSQHLNSHSNLMNFSPIEQESYEDKEKTVVSEGNTNDEEKTVKSNKIYRCEVSNCNKSYTSAYGLRYHMEKGHKEDDDQSKPFACMIDACKKRYKNANGLKYHVLHSHK